VERQGRARHHSTPTARRRLAAGRALTGHPPDAATSRQWLWPPRLIPTVWPPDGGELLLIAALTRHPACQTPADVTAITQLYPFGLFDGDHLLIPRPPDVTVRRGRASVNLTIGGMPWGGCSAPAGPEWATTGSCLVGIAEGIAGLRGSDAAHAFTALLYQQQGVIASADVNGEAFAVHIAKVTRRYGHIPPPRHIPPEGV